MDQFLTHYPPKRYFLLENNIDKEENLINNICPECFSELVPEGRCYYCPSCGFSKCSVN